MEITLISAIFGMGNANHDHMHRHNTLNPNTQDIDTLKMEVFQGGGVSASTLGQIAQRSGGVSSNAYGVVNIEDGWNVRRGIGLLKFQVANNSLSSKQLSVLGYLAGGTATPEGVSMDTFFVPVRAWGLDTRSTSDLFGMPITKTCISSSNQFLMNDPFLQKKLKSIRPLDIGNETLGLLACEQEDEGLSANYDGMLTADLANGVVVSKTDNLNPSHHARELLRIAVSATRDSDHGLLENSIGDSLMGASLNEEPVTQNEFFHAMMSQLGHYNLAGFNGFTVEEINSVFSNLPECMNLNLLDPTMFAEVDNLLSTHENGTASLHEIVANELAYMTVHLLIKAGLTHISFAASNDPQTVGGITGSDDGVEIVTGPFQSVFDHDDFGIQRVEDFKQMLKNQFFSKYSTSYAHQQTILSVEVSCFIFGETSVTVFFNGDQANSRTWVNASYAINRTSTNIAAADVGLQQARNFTTNIKEYFTG